MLRGKIETIFLFLPSKAYPINLDNIYKSSPSHTTSMEESNNPEWVKIILELKNKKREIKK